MSLHLETRSWGSFLWSWHFFSRSWHSFSCKTLFFHTHTNSTNVLLHVGNKTAQRPPQPDIKTLPATSSEASTEQCTSGAAGGRETMPDERAVEEAAWMTIRHGSGKSAEAILAGWTIKSGVGGLKAHTNSTNVSLHVGNRTAQRP
ncbi:hypothetical protein VOLCADRAFT_96693 [Volvox carteri f. nagariensis]|uniref:Uncharacterized protein n=1 Tax=Volvox carteri f. nagariensis TaxID=3068 RepID=D8UAT5_VOLCA|nr:uncharacterized protein VOLCADRAFT_96693 [Volvox carteri f. nagariensis]EFJ43157.1 hypothetical protein VOLCADRAFT_96693 [Volvox carteri f. nagariensis]|eukprot:XP_002955732.1 hypothetical protein VOLCADRAFT_96693 [Volvox carteri f. nagariensis]